MRSDGQRGAVLAAVVLSIMLGLAVVTAVLIYVGWSFVRQVRVVETSRHGTRIETPLGSLRVRKHDGDPRLLGIPVYPGAMRQDDHQGSASIQFETPSSEHSLALVVAEYTTPDTVEQVTEFYRRELPHWMVSRPKGHGMRFEFTEDGYKRIIAIRQREGRTSIGLASVGEPASN